VTVCFSYAIYKCSLLTYLLTYQLVKSVAICITWLLCYQHVRGMSSTECPSSSTCDELLTCRPPGCCELSPPLHTPSSGSLHPCASAPPGRRPWTDPVSCSLWRLEVNLSHHTAFYHSLHSQLNMFNAHLVHWLQTSFSKLHFLDAYCMQRISLFCHFHIDNCLFYASKPLHVATSSLYEQFNDDYVCSFSSCYVFFALFTLIFVFFTSLSVFG